MHHRRGALVVIVLTSLAALRCGGDSDSKEPGGAGSAGAANDGGTAGSVGGGRGGQAGTAAGGRAGTGGQGGRSGGTSGRAGTGGEAGATGGEAGATAGEAGAGAGEAGATGGEAGATGGEAGAAGGPAGQAGEAGAGGAANAFVPSDLGSRLVLWFDAARGVSAADGARMDEWLDQSSAHNDALQSVVARQPIYTTSGVNDLPAVAFDGETTFLEIPDDATLRFGTGPFALFAVVRGAPATGINAMVYQKSDADDPWAGPALLVNPNKPAASTKASFQLDGSTYVNSSGSVGDSVPRLLGGRRFQGSTGTRVELRIDGVPESNVVPNAAVNVDAPGRNAIIGHNGYLPSPGFQAYAGTISEICAVKGSLSDDELAGLEGYLLDKYGLR